MTRRYITPSVLIRLEIPIRHQLPVLMRWLARRKWHPTHSHTLLISPFHHHPYTHSLPLTTTLGSPTNSQSELELATCPPQGEWHAHRLSRSCNACSNLGFISYCLGPRYPLCRGSTPSTALRYHIPLWFTRFKHYYVNSAAAYLYI